MEQGTHLRGAMSQALLGELYEAPMAFIMFQLDTSHCDWSIIFDTMPAVQF